VEESVRSSEPALSLRRLPQGVHPQGEGEGAEARARPRTHAFRLTRQAYQASRHRRTHLQHSGEEGALPETSAQVRRILKTRGACLGVQAVLRSRRPAHPRGPPELAAKAGVEGVSGVAGLPPLPAHLLRRREGEVRPLPLLRHPRHLRPPRQGRQQDTPSHPAAHHPHQKYSCPYPAALNKRDPEIIATMLKVIQKLVLSGDMIGEALVPYYRQILPIFNIFRNNNTSIGDKIEYSQRKRLNLGDLIG
jgi:hypothetical protein